MDNACGEMCGCNTTRRKWYLPDDLNKLNVVHVTGTKGKGSASAFTSSILCKAKPDCKIGLYTSPHIVAVRERIRRLSRDTLQTLLRNPCTSVSYLVAFHAFYTLKVDATILEVGIGGTYDSTNIVPKPIVAGIASLGLGHQGVLGNTLPEIAWQKGGIYIEEGVPALPVNQPDDAMEVLRKRAEELKASEFVIVPATGVHITYPKTKYIQPLMLVLNACLAVAMAQKILEVKKSLEPESTLSEAFVEGLEQIIQDPRGRTTWFLDGAHTIESLDCCIRWFVSPGVGIPREASHRPAHVLVFNITHERSGPSLLRAMNAAKLDQLKLYGRDEDPEMFFDEVIFCTNTTYIDGASNRDLVSLSATDEDRPTTQRELASAWSGLKPAFPSSHALQFIDRIGQEAGTAGVYALVTGSLHLVAGFIDAALLSDVAL
ncbi:Mur ligase [Athelia psychrophila]|uniref:tetrahydrofolate synthase n=1 Tax=Athelia psychrophila TaxID=1759441 RepID=A0A166T475_9AGAM|nr:Mur ligase [Fibularhizoctonia sp. CBS 109695]